MTEADRAETTSALAALLRETEAAHRAAFGDGEDPDWALFWAERLRGPLKERLGIDMSRTRIVVCLVDLEEERRASESKAPRADEYARKMVERCVSREDETLALYYYPQCFFCRRVTTVIDELSIDVELRNILTDPEHAAALLAARGRRTVPVLRCTSGGEDRWMPESADIVRYLRERFG